MGSSLAPVLANILTEFEKVVVTPLMECEILKFYCRYVDDTLVLVKEGQIDKILKTFNSFHNNFIGGTTKRGETKFLKFIVGSKRVGGGGGMIFDLNLVGEKPWTKL